MQSRRRTNRACQAVIELDHQSDEKPSAKKYDPIF
jgi:hypothetical protein